MPPLPQGVTHGAPHVPPEEIRTAFSRAMSQMYRAEVPQYGTLVDLVAEVNTACLAADPALNAALANAGELERLDVERHGAIRLGTAAELFHIRRLFAVMGMHPVGYYDLSVAGVPVHSTVFRPIGDAALRRNPFRVFTSLLRLELIADAGLRAEAERILSQRRIFTPRALELVATFEAEGGLDAAQAETFVREALETFRWHREATVDRAAYERLIAAHRLIADVVCFRGPHINHLTPRTLDIDAVQALMPAHGIAPKAVIEGPPRRACPILLRQTSFKALEEPVAFAGEGTGDGGTHTARFGEIEQRGIALTPEGRRLYDALLDAARADTQASGSHAGAYEAALSARFRDFPDDWKTMRRDGLAYFRYAPTEAGLAAGGIETSDPEALVAAGHLGFSPIVYEDFLPVSAAGIFQSNLGGATQASYAGHASREAFEAALGARLADPFALYAEAQARSLTDALVRLGQRRPHAASV